MNFFFVVIALASNAVITFFKKIAAAWGKLDSLQWFCIVVCVSVLKGVTNGVLNIGQGLNRTNFFVSDNKLWYRT